MKKLLSTLLLASTIGFALIPSAYSSDKDVNSYTSSTQNELININNASFEELKALPGIGVKKAQAIIDYRTDNGRFLSVSELTNVKGIGKKMLEKLEGKVSAG